MATIAPTSVSSDRCTSRYGRANCRVHGTFNALSIIMNSAVAKRNLAASLRDLKSAHGSGDFEERIETDDLVRRDQLLYDATTMGTHELERLLRQREIYQDEIKKMELEIRLTRAKEYRMQVLHPTAPGGSKVLGNRYTKYIEFIEKYSTEEDTNRGIDLKDPALASLPVGTPLAFRFKNGTVLYVRSTDNYGGKFATASRLDRLFDGKPRSGDGRQREFSIIVSSGLDERDKSDRTEYISLTDVEELHVLRPEAFDGGFAQFQNSEAKGLIKDEGSNSSAYRSIVSPSFYLEGEVYAVGVGRRQAAEAMQSETLELSASPYVEGSSFSYRVDSADAYLVEF